ncbi:TetR/AcrR family transcriptional regulator [Arenibacter sp. 6A1]|uniref:TetR/AcrR family transcriptional regulator n=1 Tax=Arenibacter sp. 6A1 TaxID=2720391 RepID=UPI001447A5F2|nr:TetR/AcrR family transcriptional regulator [Arenibacter sp. 6A1]NKI26826.1 TetR/AcrR family transcriptional regulator [Arenibacter sp. 6A1]
MAIRQKSTEKRTALLQATLSLVNDNGFHDAPMSKIAKLAGVSPATIYLYFENKQDLINNLYISVKATFSTHAFKDYEEGMTVAEGFKNIWYNIADYKLTQVEEAYFLSQCDNTTMIDEETRQEGLKHLQPLLDLWKRGQEEGLLKNTSLYQLYAFSIYPLAFLMTMQKRGLYQWDTQNLDIVFQSAWDSIKK